MMLRSARAEISARQADINDPTKGDKHLTGGVVLTEAVANYRRTTGVDPLGIPPDSREARLPRLQMKGVREAMDASHALLNTEGIGFKGFIPAVFDRLDRGRSHHQAHRPTRSRAQPQGPVRPLGSGGHQDEAALARLAARQALPRADGA